MSHQFRYRIVALTMIPLLALSALAFVAPQSAHAAGSIQLSRSTVARGDRISVSGVGFTPNDSVVISTGFRQYTNGQIRYVQTTPRTSNTGTFLTAFTVPSATYAGVYTVNARDFHGNKAATQLTVLPLVPLNVSANHTPSTTIVARGFFFASGHGFKPGEQVQLAATFQLFNGNSVDLSRTVQADSKGNFRGVMLQIPLDAKTGNVGMIATGTSSGSKAASNINVVYRPAISLNATTYRPGGNLTVTGVGFIPNTTVHITVPVPNGSSTFTVSKDVQADGQGNFSATLALPQTTPAGNYSVTATGALIGPVASTKLVVGLQPVVALASGSVLPGHNVKVTGGGFSSNVTVQVSANFPLYGGGSKTLTKNFTTDASGNFSGYFYVPGHAAAGTVTLTAKGPNTLAHISLQIRHIGASVHLTPASLVPGSAVTITGAGYLANDKVDISLAVIMTNGTHRTLTTSAQTGNNGAFSVSLSIPGDVATGTYTLIARSEATGRAPSAKLSLSVSGRLSVQPNAAQPGHSVTVHGNGFGANVSVTLSVNFVLYTGGARTVTKTVTTDGSGNLTATISIPRDASPGSATVVAHGPNAHVSANLQISHLSASVVASPVSAIPGSTVYINGAGYLSGSHIDITVTVKTLTGSGQTLTAQAIANTSGHFSVPVKLPTNAVGGSYTVTAKSRDSGRAPTTQLTVVALKASIVVTPTTAVPGTQVTVNGFGYAASSAVDLLLNGQKVGSATTDASGKFTTNITVPANSASGTYSLEAKGSSGLNATLNVVVNRQVSTHFYFASLYTGTGYHEYLTILNPTAIKARVTITYEPTTGATKSKTVTVNATSRFTEDVNADLGPKVSTAAVVSADVPIAAERLVYHGTDGSIVPGTISPANTWYFANGNTSGNYREYVAIQNPSSNQIQVGIRMLPTHRAAFTIYRTMPPMSRTTVKVSSYVRDAVGVIVNSSTPVVANRTIFIRHGMNSKIGVNAPHTSWYFAAGPANTATKNYIGLINPSNGRSHVTLHIYNPFGQLLKTVGGSLKPFARTFWLMNKLVGRTDVAVVVQTSRPSVVEQTTYTGKMHDASTDTFGAPNPVKTWDFAAVNTVNGSDVLNLFNPNLAPVPVVVQFMTAAGSVTQRTYVISPLSHQRIDVGSVVPNAQLGLVATSNLPIVALNRMFFNNRLGSATSIGIHS